MRFWRSSGSWRAKLRMRALHRNLHTKIVVLKRARTPKGTYRQSPTKPMRCRIKQIAGNYPTELFNVYLVSRQGIVWIHNGWLVTQTDHQCHKITYSGRISYRYPWVVLASARKGFRLFWTTTLQPIPSRKSGLRSCPVPLRFIDSSFAAPSLCMSSECFSSCSRMLKMLLSRCTLRTLDCWEVDLNRSSFPLLSFARTTKAK